MSEGVGNPVYDTFNEGQPLEDVSYFIHLKAWTVSWLSSSFFQLYQLRVLVRSGTWQITREWQNHSFLSNKYISQALYQTKIMNFEKLRKPARPTTAVRSIFFHPSFQPFVLSVLFTHSFNVLSSYFDVSLNLVVVPTVWIWINVVRQLFLTFLVCERLHGVINSPWKVFFFFNWFS